MTLLEVTIQSLLKAGSYNKDVQAKPVCILWPDKERQWESVIPRLRSHLPQLLTLGGYDPGKKTGPAIWLKCMIARTLPEADWPEHATPVLYLPGVGRGDLRAIESCPRDLQPLAELQYRGVFWTQKNGRDWTLFAFLKSKEGGAGLDVSHDDKTQEALRRAFAVVLSSPLVDFQGRRLEAQDFDDLLSPDPVRDLLRWLNDPTGTRTEWAQERWESFQAVCSSAFSFDPVSDGELAGAELLVKGGGKWGEVWARFVESPDSYVNLPDLLRRTKVSPDLFADRERWPQINDEEELSLRNELINLSSRAPHEARAGVGVLEKQHGKRRTWVWARLGKTPLAQSLKHIAEMAALAQKLPTGDTIEDLRTYYVTEGWRIDRAALLALGIPTKADDVAAVQEALRCIYLPWLEECALRFQGIIERRGYPVPKTSSREEHEAGECMLFVDGLRYDVANMLRELAETRACVVEVSSRWTTLPTITNTTKPAASPIAHALSGGASADDFLPWVTETGKPLTAYSFRKMLENEGWQFVPGGETGDPQGRAWCETGRIDRQGHEQGWRLARRLMEEVREAVEYIEKLLDRGWKKVNVVTDHGWLLIPGGLPKIELAKCLTETRWGRCAIVKDNAKVDGLLLPWHWSREVTIALPAGVGCYTAGREYDHGGITLQECIIPVLTVSRPGGTSLKATIREHVWRGLRCRAAVESDAGGLTFDIRTKAGDPGSSVVHGGKQIVEQGMVSVVVEDEGLMGTAAFLVILDPENRVIAKESTSIGED